MNTESTNSMRTQVGMPKGKMQTPKRMNLPVTGAPKTRKMSANVKSAPKVSKMSIHKAK